MAEFRLSSEAEAELDSIWLYIARESGSIEIASRAIDTTSIDSGCSLSIHTLEGGATTISVRVCAA